MIDKKKKHAFITLGLRLNENGYLENEAIGRLNKTLEAYNGQKESFIIVSGGNKKNNRTEAKAMKEWLVRRKIPDHKIIEENESKDTVENAIYSMRIVNKEKFQSFSLITSDTHIKRAFILFKRLDFYNKLSSFIIFTTEKVTTSLNCREDELIKKNLKELNKRIKSIEYDHNYD